MIGADYEKYLQYQVATQSSNASVAQTGNSTTFLTQSFPLGPWILDSGVIDHMFDNQHFISHFVTSPSLPTITLVNGP